MKADHTLGELMNKVLFFACIRTSEKLFFLFFLRTRKLQAFGLFKDSICFITENNQDMKNKKSKRLWRGKGWDLLLTNNGTITCWMNLFLDQYISLIGHSRQKKLVLIVGNFSSDKNYECHVLTDQLIFMLLNVINSHASVEKLGIND